MIEIPGPRLLPFAGGLMDQPAILLDAFAVMDETAATLATTPIMED